MNAAQRTSSIALIALLLCSSGASAQAQTPLPSTFFGIGVIEPSTAHFPTVPFGALRLWTSEVGWALIETAPNHYDWTKLDFYLSEAKTHNKELLYTFGQVPSWAVPPADSMNPSAFGNTGAASPPADVGSGDATFKAFVTAVVQHSLASTTGKIKYYELWNEPDLMGTWQGTASQLVTMGRDAYTIIHALDPNALVIGPSPSTSNQYGVHFLPAYYAAGGAPYQDIVGCHAYMFTNGVFSQQADELPGGIRVSISSLKTLMASYGISSKPIVYTEGCPGNTNSGMSDLLKVAYIGQEYVLMWAAGVAAYFWYQWDNTAWGTMWTTTGGINAVGIAYTQLYDWMVGSTHAASPCSQASDSTWTCELTLANGSAALIMWNPNGSKTIATTFSTYQTLDNANVNTVSAGGTVTIDTKPILLSGVNVTMRPIAPKNLTAVVH